MKPTLKKRSASTVPVKTTSHIEIPSADQNKRNLFEKLAVLNSFSPISTMPTRIFSSLSPENQCLVRSADSGNLDICIKVSQNLISGINGFPVDIDVGLKYMTRAATIGSADSYIKIGILSKERGQLEKAAEYFKKAADSGCPEGMLYYGLSLRYGYGVKKSYHQAYKYYKKSCVMGYPRGINAYAVALEEGVGCQKNTILAAKFYQKAIKMGCPMAMRNYGLLFEDGIGGLKQSYKNAFKYVKMAVECGDNESLVILGYYYENGFGTPKNLKMSAEYYKKSAECGNTQGMIAFGRFLMDGIEMKKSLQEALWYFKTAYLKGDIEGKKYYDFLYDQMQKYGINNPTNFIKPKPQSPTKIERLQSLPHKEKKKRAISNFEELSNSSFNSVKDVILEPSNLSANHSLSSISNEVIGKNRFEDFSFYNSFGVPSNQKIGKISTFHSSASIASNRSNSSFGRRRLLEETPKILSNAVFDALTPENQRLVLTADRHDDMDAGLQIAKNLIDGQNGFEKDVYFGMKYVELTCAADHLPSLLYYAHLLTTGLIIDRNNELAEEIYTRAADLGDVESCVHVGDLLLKRKDDILAFKHFEHAAKMNDLNGILKLAFMYEKGRGCKKDRNEAGKLYKIAYDKGDLFGYAKWGIVVYFGIGVPSDKEEGFKLCRFSAENGCTEGMTALGIIFLKGRGIEPNPAEAIKWFKKAAEFGDSYGMLRIGSILEKGIGIKSDMKEAVKYYKRAAELGNSKAQFHYGRMLDEGKGVAKDHKEAARFYKMAADDGIVMAAATYAMMRLEGKLIYRDMSEACKYFKISADLGNVMAMFNYAQMKMSGKGVEKNTEEAVCYYKLAAENGHKKSMMCLSIFYHQGLTAGQENKIEAVKYAKMAADNGMSEGMYTYAMMLENGYGIKADSKKSAEFFKKAAELDHGMSQFFYAQRLEEGKGIKKDKKKALEYYKLASDKQIKGALARYKKLAKELHR